MVGPYEELHKCYQSPGYLPDPEQCIQNHMRYRYYYDPPELLVCVISVRDHWHVGIYNDIPQETASICVSNDQVQKKTRENVYLRRVFCFWKFESYCNYPRLN